MFLWGRSKEMKKVTHLEIEEIEVVVMSASTLDEDNINCSKCNGGKDHDNNNNSSKSEHEGKEDLASTQIVSYVTA